MSKTPWNFNASPPDSPTALAPKTESQARGFLSFLGYRKTLRLALAAGVVFGILFTLVRGNEPSSPLSHDNKESISLALVPPSYLKKRPLMLLSPAGQKTEIRALQPALEGSTLELRVDGMKEPPSFSVAGFTVPFDQRDDGIFTASVPLDRAIVSDTVSVELKKGWKEIGAWYLHLESDQPPSVTLTEPPQIMARFTTKLAFDVSDDNAVASIAVRARLAGIPNAPWSYLPLFTSSSLHSQQTVFADLTFMPFAGKRAELQLVATDAKGQTATSTLTTLEMPVRTFEQPLARALIDERQRLLLNAKNESIRNEIANLLASVSRQTKAYGKDPTVMMALRAAAVRLVLSDRDEAVSSVAEILWKTATRIEDGKLGQVQDIMRRSALELDRSLALFGQSEPPSTSTLRDAAISLARLQAFLTHFLEAYTSARAEQPPTLSDAAFVIQAENDFWTREDLYAMLDRVRDFAEHNDFAKARQALLRFQIVMENVKLDSPALSDGVRDTLARAQALRLLAKGQKMLRDQSFIALHKGASTISLDLRKKMITQQELLQQKLRLLLEPPPSPKTEAVLRDADALMTASLLALQAQAFPSAYKNQGATADQILKAAALLIESAHTELATATKAKKD